MELAPLVGLADVIVDLVATGGTLRANGLVETEIICQVSSRLVVNKAALKTKSVEIKRSEEHTSELQSLMRNSYAVFCLKKKKNKYHIKKQHTTTYVKLQK